MGKIILEFNSICILNARKGKIGLKQDDILYVKASGKESIIFLVRGEKKIITHSIKELENILQNPAFFRCHRSYIVSCKNIISFTGNIVSLNNGTVLPLSKVKYNDFIKNYARFLLS